MERIPNKIKQWIEEKKGPGSAHWQGGLEEILNVSSPHMEPGKDLRILCAEISERAKNSGVDIF